MFQRLYIWMPTPSKLTMIVSATFGSSSYGFYVFVALLWWHDFHFYFLLFLLWINDIAGLAYDLYPLGIAFYACHVSKLYLSHLVDMLQIIFQ